MRPKASRKQRGRVLTEWFRQRLKERIPALLEKWQTIVGVQVNDWKVRQMKTKWGTCQKEAKRIWLNLELAKKPVHCLEYVIVHELVHLLERNHNEHFIAQLDKYVPQWRFYQKELNQFILSHEKWQC